MSEQLSLSFAPKVEELQRLLSAVEDLAQRENWPEGLIFRATLVLEELALNIVNHAHSEMFDVTLASDADAVTIEIVDSGSPFNPLTDAPPPDLVSSVGERKVGGLGVHFVKTMMDEVSYHRKGDRNHLTMVVHRDE